MVDHKFDMRCNVKKCKLNSTYENCEEKYFSKIKKKLNKKRFKFVNYDFVNALIENTVKPFLCFRFGVFNHKNCLAHSNSFLFHRFHKSTSK